MPFLIAALGPVGNWRDYPELFNQSWNIVVRYVAAWLFMGLFWAVLLLSNELFGIIGLEILDDLLDIAPVPYVLSGLVLGLALAVVNELSEYVSPYLILRLLRLLLPLVSAGGRDLCGDGAGARAFRPVRGAVGGGNSAGDGGWRDHSGQHRDRSVR